MKSFNIFFSNLILFIASLPLIILLLTLEGEPAVPPNPPLDLAQINEIQQLLIDKDPLQLLASDFQEVRLTGNELNSLITYIRNSNPAVSAINISTSLVDNGASLSLSIPIAILGLYPYFNITLHFIHVDDGLELEHVDAGALSIPSPLLASLRRAVTAQLSQDESFQLVTSFFDSLDFKSINEQRVVVMLDWQEENRRQLGDQARQVFVSAREAERLMFYHEKLLDTAASFPEGMTSQSLNTLLRPLFLFASINSAGGASAIAENRAVFIVLSAYLTDLELSQFLENEVSLPSPKALNVVIEFREDLARHVVSTAAIAASSGATMAKVLSVYKEVHDSRYRTGFSFTDIAANMAGSLLGTLASRSEADAIRFQELMMDINQESDYIPLLGTYDGMSEEEFVALYGSRESEAYRQRLLGITDSISARPFYQAFEN